MRIETDRLLIRRLTEKDAAALYAVLSDPEVMRFIESPFSMEQTRAFIRDAGLCEPPLVYAVVWKQTDELIGHLIWHPWDEAAMELGWIIRRDFWGRGIAKELTAVALTQTDMDVVLECSPDQTATRHIAEAFGFQLIPDHSNLLRYRKLAQKEAIERKIIMTDSVSLCPMTAELYHAYYKEYQNDPDLYVDKSKYTPFVYSPEWVDRYIQRQRDLNRKCFAIMVGSEMAGEVILKNIEPGKCATLGICLKNDSCKNRGIGTQAERLAIEYVFHDLDLPVLYADSLLTNERSRHVLEKVGFRYLRTEGDFMFYRIVREETWNTTVE